MSNKINDLNKRCILLFFFYDAIRYVICSGLCSIGLCISLSGMLLWRVFGILQGVFMCFREMEQCANN